MAESSEPKTYTEDDIAAIVAEKLAEAKAEGDKAFQQLWNEGKSAKERARELERKLAEAQQNEKAQKAGITSDELERIRAEIRNDLETGEYGQFKTQAQTLAQENRQLKLDNVVKGIMGKHGVRSERIDALFKLTSDKFDLTDDGKPMLKDRMGTPVEKFVMEDLAKEYPEFYAGSGSSGGGATKSSGGAGGAVRQIASTNSSDFLAHLTDIASGKTTVG